jgi:hypothetical protein
MIAPSQAADRILLCIPRNLCATPHSGDLSIDPAWKSHHNARTRGGIVECYAMDVSHRLDQAKPKTAARNRLTVGRMAKPPEDEFMLRDVDTRPIVADGARCYRPVLLDSNLTPEYLSWLFSANKDIRSQK